MCLLFNITIGEVIVMRKPSRIVVWPIVVVFFGTILFLLGQVIFSFAKEFWPIIKIVMIVVVATIILGGARLLVYSIALGIAQDRPEDKHE